MDIYDDMGALSRHFHLFANTYDKKCLMYRERVWVHKCEVWKREIFLFYFYFWQRSAKKWYLKYVQKTGWKWKGNKYRNAIPHGISFSNELQNNESALKIKQLVSQYFSHATHFQVTTLFIRWRTIKQQCLVTLKNICFT